MSQLTALLCPDAPTVSGDDTVQHATGRLKSQGASFAVVRDGERVTGVVFAEQLLDGDPHTLVSRLQQRTTCWVGPTANPADALDAVRASARGIVLVGSPTDFAGCLTAHSLLRGASRVDVTLAPTMTTQVEPSYVLIVEDEPNVRELECRVVEEAGHRPLPAACLEDARGLIARYGAEICLVILDVHLPDGLGIDLCSEIVGGAWPAAEAVPIMMVTSEADGELVANAFFAGSVRHFSKPFQPLDLLKAVEEVAYAA